eukprot:767944-Hanusia_phi.AAC.5
MHFYPHELSHLPCSCSVAYLYDLQIALSLSCSIFSSPSRAASSRLLLIFSSPSRAASSRLLLIFSSPSLAASSRLLLIFSSPSLAASALPFPFPRKGASSEGSMCTVSDRYRKNLHLGKPLSFGRTAAQVLGGQRSRSLLVLSL